MLTDDKRINFNYNWNKKLDCNCYTTLRLTNDNKYVIGDNYNIYLDNNRLHTSIIIDIKRINISSINDYIGYLDTGYSAIETIALLKKMYPNYDFFNKTVSFILLKKIS